ncbi:MAG: EthD family reductase [Thermoflexales bacterium]|nr:EthD family reductase [Thermoflexales bacterium]
MVKLIIFFRKPADVEAFESHFACCHVPLINAMPNVLRTTVSRALGAPRGEPPYYLIHEVYFRDLPSLTYALNSAEGRAAGADLMTFARDIVTVMFAEVWGEDALNGAPAPRVSS